MNLEEVSKELFEIAWHALQEKRDLTNEEQQYFDRLFDSVK